MKQHGQTASFDRVARIYRWAEYLLLGRLLARTRTSLLAHVGSAQHALVLGDGDGRFLATLLRSRTHLTAIAVDSSATMLRLLQRRCAFASARLRVFRLPVAQVSAVPDLQQTDLIVTHFLLDCLSQEDTEALALTLAQQVAPGTLWLLSDFACPPQQPWRTLGETYIRALYAVFALLTRLPVRQLPDMKRALQQAGFRRLHCRTLAKGLLFSELWQLSHPASE